MEELPPSVGHLIHLRYLDVIGTFAKLSSKSILPLYFLQTLIAYPIHKLKDPASGKSSPLLDPCKLLSLRDLLSNCLRPAYLQCLNIVGFKSLTALQELKFLVKKKEGCRINDLEDMKELCLLEIEDLHEISDQEEVVRSKLKEKMHLKELCLQWGRGDNSIADNIFDSLKPHFGLKKLSVRCHPGTRSAYWLGSETGEPLKLEYLHICNCSKWKNLPLQHLPFLKELILEDMLQLENIGSTTVTGSCHWLPQLSELEIMSCPMLKTLPFLPSRLKKLLIFDVGITTLPEWEKRPDCTTVNQGNEGSLLKSFLFSLKSLLFSFFPREKTPDCATVNQEALLKSFLLSLRIVTCHALISLDQGLLQQNERLKSLQELQVFDCQELVHFPADGFEKFTSLRYLSIVDCPKLVITPSMKHFLPPALETLHLENCGDMDSSLHILLAGLTSLSRLSLSSCSHLTSFPVPLLSRLSVLCDLQIRDCGALISLDGLQNVSSLKYLTITGCPELVNQTNVDETECNSSLLKLDKLEIDHPSLLLNVPVLKSLTSTRAVTIKNCSPISMFPAGLEIWLQKNNISLQELCLHEASSLESLPEIFHRLKSLEYLELSDIHRLRSMPKLPMSLKKLCIYGCEQEFVKQHEKEIEDIPYKKILVDRWAAPPCPYPPPP